MSRLPLLLALSCAALSGLFGLSAAGCSFAADEAGTGIDASGNLTGEADSGTEDSAQDAGENEAETGAEESTGTGSPQVDMMKGDCDYACDPYDPQACDEGSKCVPATCEAGSAGYDTHTCRPVTGDQKAGEPCVAEGRDGIDDCAAGLVCWGADPSTGAGHCEPLCGGSVESPECEPGRVCGTFGSAKIALCVSTCDPLEQNCPVSGDACLPLPGSASFACLPGPADGGLGYGETCEFANACEPGALCVDGMRVPEAGCGESQDCCSPLCSLQDPVACPGEGQICAPLDPALNVGEDWPNVGVCSLP